MNRRYGTQRYGLVVDLAALSLWLDSMILRVAHSSYVTPCFSNHQSEFVHCQILFSVPTDYLVVTKLCQGKTKAGEVLCRKRVARITLAGADRLCFPSTKCEKVCHFQKKTLCFSFKCQERKGKDEICLQIQWQDTGSGRLNWTGGSKYTGPPLQLSGGTPWVSKGACFRAELSLYLELKSHLLHPEGDALNGWGDWFLHYHQKKETNKLAAFKCGKILKRETNAK